MLEEIRLLSNLETATSKLLQIVLVGQPELKGMLARPELRQLRQRIVLRFDLQPMDEPEMRDYVNERLALAGYTGEGVFKKASLRELYRATGGVPRLINIVCDGSLLQGYAKDAVKIDAKIVREVAQGLELDGVPKAVAPSKQKEGRGWFRGISELFR
jgi:general secretion pathway protein A